MPPPNAPPVASSTVDPPPHAQPTTPGDLTAQAAARPDASSTAVGDAAAGPAPAPTAQVIVERPAPGLARGEYAWSPWAIGALGLATLALGSAYFVWRLRRKS